jgi:hypothetical protein
MPGERSRGLGDAEVPLAVPSPELVQEANNISKSSPARVSSWLVLIFLNGLVLRVNEQLLVFKVKT